MHGFGHCVPGNVASVEQLVEPVVLRGGSSLITAQPLVAPPMPRPAKVAFVLLFGLCAMQALQGQFTILGHAEDDFVNHVVNNALMLCASLITLLRAMTFPRERLAWGFMTGALVCYTVGDILWTGVYADAESYATLADIPYMAFFPLTMLSLIVLVRGRIECFDFSRWIDGIAAALLVATPGVVFVVEPQWSQSRELGISLLERVVLTAYPILDTVLLGAVIGVAALTGWRPGRAWAMLAIGLAMFVAADSVYTIQSLKDAYHEGQWDFLWTGAALLMAMAAWVSPIVHKMVFAWGWRAIALPVLCQMAPIVMVLYGGEPTGEQILTVAVLAIVLVQLVVTRPRAPEDIPEHHSPAAARALPIVQRSLDG
jgi:hypothetical protein